MMKKIFVVYFIAMLFVLGCSSAKNINFIKQKENIRIAPHKNGSLLINLQTSSFDWSDKGVIDTNLSYAINEEGKKYRLTVNPFQVAHNHPKPTVFTSDFVWIVTPNNKLRMNWYNSIWSIYIVLKSARGTEVFKTTFELSDR